jgi:hypothetical protein
VNFPIGNNMTAPGTIECWSDREILVTPPSNAISGAVTVVTPQGSITTADTYSMCNGWRTLTTELAVGRSFPAGGVISSTLIVAGGEDISGNVVNTVSLLPVPTQATPNPAFLSGAPSGTFTARSGPAYVVVPGATPKLFVIGGSDDLGNCLAGWAAQQWHDLDEHLLSECRQLSWGQLRLVDGLHERRPAAEVPAGERLLLGSSAFNDQSRPFGGRPRCQCHGARRCDASNGHNDHAQLYPVHDCAVPVCARRPGLRQLQ